MKVVDRSFKSFFKLLKKCKKGEYSYHDVKIPHYHKKGGMFTLIMSQNAISISDGYFQVPMSRAFRSAHPDLKEILIPFPERLKDKVIKEVRILPCNHGKVFKIQYVYKTVSEDLHLNKNNILSIDPGVDNIAACITTIGTSFIVDGRKLKSINHQWNKEVARLRSISMKQKLNTTERINKITEKRNNQVKDAIRKTARYIINYCIEHDIGKIVFGYNPGIKQNSDMGKINNQNFVQIPHGDLRQQLEYLCDKYGMEYIEQEESYTSKSSFLDLDVLPVYLPEQPYLGEFKGRRIYRGLYKSQNGTIMNADINGSANILRKSKQNFDYEKLCIGLLASPQRIRVA